MGSKFVTLTVAVLGFLVGCSPPAQGEPSSLQLSAIGVTDTVSGVAEFEIRASGQFETDLEFFVGDRFLEGWVPVSVAQFQFDTRELADGPHTFEIQALKRGGELIWDQIALNVDNGGPIVSFHEPLTDDVFLEDGAFLISMNVEDDVGVDEVSIFVNDALQEKWTLPRNPRLSVSYDPGSAAGAEELEIRVEATDRGGRSSTATRKLELKQREAFSLSLDRAVFGPLVMNDGALAIGTDDGLAIVEPSGEVRCRMSGVNTSAPLLQHPTGAIYWSTLAALEVVSAADCVRLTPSLPTPGAPVTAIEIWGEQVATVSFSGQLRIHEAVAGAVIETYELQPLAPGILEVTGALASNPDGTALFVAGASSTTQGALFVLREGAVTHTPLPSPIIGGAAANASGGFFPGNDGYLYHYSADLESVWRSPASLSPGFTIDSTPVVLSDSVVVADGMSTVHALDLHTGAAIWTHQIGDGDPRMIRRAGVGVNAEGDSLAVGDALGRVTVLDSDGFLRFQTRLVPTESVAVLGRPAVSEGRVTAVNELGLVVSFRH